MSDHRKLLNKKILIIAALLSVITSAAYACAYTPVVSSFSLRIAYIGMPGILLAAMLSIALHGGAQGAGYLLSC